MKSKVSRSIARSMGKLETSRRDISKAMRQANTRSSLLLGIIAISMCSACLADGGEQPSTTDAQNDAVDASPGQGDYSVLFKTTAGDFTVDVTRSWAPNGADRLRQLVEEKYFDDTRFFRVVPGFIVQFGISGSPSLNAMWNVATIPDDPVSQSNTRGTLTFATSGPNSRTTQLFINYVDNSFLDSMGFTPIGVVQSAGMESVDNINSEYGETPSQTDIQLQGNVYLDQNFPRLDSILSATIQ